MAIDPIGTAKSSVVHGNITSTATFTLSGGIQGGDLIFITVLVNDDAIDQIVCDTPNYNRLDNVEGAAECLATFYKVASGAVGASSGNSGDTLTFSFTGLDGQTGFVGLQLTVRGVDATTPVSASSLAAYVPSSTMRYKSVTPQHDDCFLLAVLGTSNSGTTPDVLPAPSGMVDRIEAGTGTSDLSQRRAHICTQQLVGGAGQTIATKTTSLSSGTPSHVGGMVALKPAAEVAPQPSPPPPAVVGRRYALGIIGN